MTSTLQTLPPSVIPAETVPVEGSWQLDRAAAALERHQFKAVVRDTGAFLLACPEAPAADRARAQRLRGIARAAMGQVSLASAALARAARDDPDARSPMIDAGLWLRHHGLSHRIAPLFAAAIAACRESRALTLDAAALLQAVGEAEAALMLLRGGLGVIAAPDLEAGLIAAQAELDLGALGSACRRLQVLTDHAPRSPAAWSSLGVALKIRGDLAAAHAAHDRAVALDPENPRFRLNRAVARLHAGDFAAGWPDYEHRLRMGGGMSPQTLFDPARLMPTLRALGSVEGKRVLLWHEAGFGDTLQFMRYAPLLADRGMIVSALVPASLAPVVAALPGIAAVYTNPRVLDAGATSGFDWHCPVFSLPRVFGTTLATIPAFPHLPLDPARRGFWQDWMAEARGGERARPRVGIAWRGQARPAVPGFAALDRRRSLEPQCLQPLTTIPGLCWVNVQKGAALPAEFGAIDPMPRVRDFADTAAIVAGLDVVISVDSAVAHLAAGLGRPVWLLDRFDNCWRWLHGRTDSPWYPSLRIFRQERMLDWDRPMAAVSAALRELARPRQPAL